MNHAPAELLVSVRSAADAEAALAGGAHVIDVKEPLRGSLGRASDATIAEVIDHVRGRRPVSAAMGELANPSEAAPYARPGLAFAKWGLFAMAQNADWRLLLAEAKRRVAEATPACRVVTVAYADWKWAGAPPVEEVAAFVLKHPGGVLLLDTFQKAPGRETGAAPTLLDLFSLRQVTALCGACRDAGVQVALAGSLRAAQIEELKAARPHWFAVRGAVCDEGRREGAVSVRKVRTLLDLLV
jgi:uncharacterized protein (UPF0264 family)